MIQTMYDIIKAHDGQISVILRGNEGPPAGQTGTEIIIHLPIS